MGMNCFLAKIRMNSRKQSNLACDFCLCKKKIDFRGFQTKKNSKKDLTKKVVLKDKSRSK